MAEMTHVEVGLLLYVLITGHLHVPSPQILVYSLEAERCLSKLGNALGDFTCVNLRDSPPNLMVSGNMDRRYV